MVDEKAMPGGRLPAIYFVREYGWKKDITVRECVAGPSRTVVEVNLGGRSDISQLSLTKHVSQSSRRLHMSILLRTAPFLFAFVLQAQPYLNLDFETASR